MSLQSTWSFWLWVNVAIISVLGVRMSRDRVKQQGAWLSVRKGSSPTLLSITGKQLLLLASNFYYWQATAKLFYKLIGMQVFPNSELNQPEEKLHSHSRSTKVHIAILRCKIAKRHSAQWREGWVWEQGMKCRRVSAATFTPDTVQLLTSPPSVKCFKMHQRFQMSSFSLTDWRINGQLVPFKIVPQSTGLPTLLLKRVCDVHDMTCELNSDPQFMTITSSQASELR